MRQRATTLNAGTTNDLIGGIVRRSKPSDIFAGLEHLADPNFTFGSVIFEERLRNKSHVSEHASAMRRNAGRIGNASEANLKTRSHEADLLSSMRGSNRPRVVASAERGAQMRDEALCELDRVASGEM